MMSEGFWLLAFGPLVVCMPFLLARMALDAVSHVSRVIIAYASVEASMALYDFRLVLAVVAKATDPALRAEAIGEATALARCWRRWGRVSMTLRSWV